MAPGYWESAKKHLARSDPVLKKLIKAYPNMAIASRGDEFQTLARAIVGQQISTKAAASIWNRFEACSGAVTPKKVAALAPEAMRACGLSGAKVRYIHDLAAHFATGAIRPRRWPAMDDEAIIEDLVRVKGIGRWSAEMFLMFHLMRPDLLPVDDLGLRRAMERQFNRGRALTKEKMRRIGSRWAPYRSVATWYLWRSLEPPPEAAK
ncbi:MAG TPA: DNA-3-methyladenine glycosylase [Usitatibacter sp.]|jgi:DNA-3-methyladenine glycosylase II|nr:DNA-3-methyladenine glycosylase [Usitatibacter sp.]